MELGGKGGFLGLEGRGILTGPSRETPYTYSSFTSYVQGATAVYEDARETNSDIPKTTRVYGTSGCVWIFNHNYKSWSLFFNRAFFLQE